MTFTYGFQCKHTHRFWGFGDADWNCKVLQALSLFTGIWSLLRPKVQEPAQNYAVVESFS
jgi:hypothetical protein